MTHRLNYLSKIAQKVPKKLFFWSTTSNLVKSEKVKGVNGKFMGL